MFLSVLAKRGLALSCDLQTEVCFVFCRIIGHCATECHTNEPQELNSTVYYAGNIKTSVQIDQRKIIRQRYWELSYFSQKGNKKITVFP